MTLMLSLLLSFILALAIYFSLPTLRPILTFIHSCFLSPLSHSKSLEDRLSNFYTRQANGRRTMLKLCAAELEEQERNLKRGERKELVWVDIGGGTGWNIEEMDKYYPIEKFAAVYLVDLCLPLLKVAEERFKKRGWTNVHVLHQDATKFCLPLMSERLAGKEVRVDLFTLSYSLSMIPNFYELLDRIDRFLDPVTGLVGVADFYVSGRKTFGGANEVVGDELRQVGWLSRLFWLHWFELDHVDLHPSRREYLEFKFGTRKSYNGRNRFVIPLIVRIPYYVWLGTSRNKPSPSLSVASPSQQLTIDAKPPRHSPPASDQPLENGGHMVRVEMGDKIMRGNFEYQSEGAKWRLPYEFRNFHDDFRTWIYGFTWEDPNVDMQAFGSLTQQDTVLAITSAGDNLLHYAIHGAPKIIHAVDMNPCQGHLLELKLACVQALEFNDFWKMFGEGKHKNFPDLLDRKLSPYLSTQAYAFWRRNSKAFNSSFYLRGYSGWALRLIKWSFILCGAQGTVKKICDTKSLKEQIDLWENRLKPILTSRLIKFVLGNPIFMWNALGVPKNQAHMLLSETDILQYILDTLDPVVHQTLLSSTNYHYLLTLQQRYSSTSRPAYLTPDGFERLRLGQGEGTGFKIHTESLAGALSTMKEELTVVVLLDALDWFPDEMALKVTLDALRGALKKGGRAFFRSAATDPWYAKVFERNGFRVSRLGCRDVGKGKMIDQVNMYASFWKATKI
ncbi:hypothetical protein BT69DRAFT_1312438 [Atractiella rhizophila]|nr:hypothetical protein BT69DRAFT_1312438 [Atractiella rhizophila]